MIITGGISAGVGLGASAVGTASLAFPAIGILAGLGAVTGITSGIMGYKGGDNSAAMYEAQRRNLRIQKDMALVQSQYQESALMAEAQTHLDNAALIAGESAGLELISQGYDLETELKTTQIGAVAATRQRQLLESIQAVSGAQVTGFAKAGVTGEGTPALVINESWEKGMEDIQAVKEAASLEELNAVMAGHLAQAELSRQGARMHATASESYGMANASYGRAGLVKSVRPLMSQSYDLQGHIAGMQAYQARLQGTAGLFSGLSQAGFGFASAWGLGG